jgi:hypothetical protein
MRPGRQDGELIVPIAGVLNVECWSHNCLTPCLVCAGTARNQWWYRDPKGNVQGPYPAQALLDWRVKGYFTDSIEVRIVSSHIVVSKNPRGCCILPCTIYPGASWVRTSCLPPDV